MTASLFIFGTIWFWILSVITFLLISISLENRKWGNFGATLTIIGFLITLYFFGGQTLGNFISYIINHPLSTIVNIAGYIFIGIIWSFVKWYYFLLNFKDSKSGKDYDQWKSYIPKVSDNKGKIISWMTYWPMSAAWTIINDPFRRIYFRIEKVYQKISDRVFKM